MPFNLFLPCFKRIFKQKFTRNGFKVWYSAKHVTTILYFLEKYRATPIMCKATYICSKNVPWLISTLRIPICLIYFVNILRKIQRISSLDQTWCQKVRYTVVTSDALDAKYLRNLYPNKFWENSPDLMAMSSILRVFSLKFRPPPPRRDRVNSCNPTST